MIFLSKNKKSGDFLKTTLSLSLLLILTACSNSTSDTSSSSEPASVATETMPVSESKTVDVVPASEIDNTNTTQDQRNGVNSNLRQGIIYNFYGEGEQCTENCLTKEQAHQLCNEIQGYSKDMLDSMINSGFMHENDRTILSNTYPNFSSSWDGKICKGKISANGLFQGTSTYVSINGNIISYTITHNNRILADYLDYRFTY